MIAVNYIGQCGFMIFTDKIALAIDPVLNDLVDESGRSMRNYPPVIPYEELAVDFVFCTHDHIDHMAKETLVTIAGMYEKTRFVVPNGCVRELAGYGIAKERIIGMADGEDIELVAENWNEEEAPAKPSAAMKLRVKSISTAHPIHQVDAEGLDHNLAYSIVMEDKRLVHLGDTYQTERLKEALYSLGPIDVFFAPVNGRDEERESRGIIGNLSCAEAADLAAALAVDLAVPMHFDMIAGNTADPFEFAECLQKIDKECKCWIPTLREQYVVM